MNLDQICAAYLRVSTHDQEEFSPDSQLRLIRDYAKQNGMELPEEFIFRDDGVSGRSAEKRPGFQRMIARARQKPRPFDRILVWKFSRFARNQEESVVYKSLLKKEAGVEVVSISEPLLDGPFGGLIERIIEWFDAFYSANLGVEVRRGMEERFSRGLAVSGAPLGYAYREGRLVPVPEEAETVRLIYREFLNGVPAASIARRLNVLGLRTKRGGAWEDRTVRYVLKNPVYTGKLRRREGGDGAGERIVKGRHPALIPEEEFEAVRHRLDTLRERGQERTAPPSPSCGALRGLVRCGACGAVLVRTGKGMNCSRYAHGKCGTSHYIGREKLETLVLAALASQLGTLEYAPRRKERDAGEEALLGKLRQKEQEALARCREAYAAGVDSLEEYRENKAAIAARLDALDRSMARLSAAAESGGAGNAREAVGVLTGAETAPEERNRLLGALAVRILFHKETRTLEIVYAAGPEPKAGA